jgi:hypothetical protein
LAQPQTPPRDLSPYLVLARFGVRIVILTVFAALGGVGFGRSFAALSAMSSVLCAIVASVRREEPFPGTLNHWDEALAYAALYFLAVGLGLSSPI